MSDLLWNCGTGFVAAIAGRRGRPPTHHCRICFSTDHGSGHRHIDAPRPCAWCKRCVSVAARTDEQRHPDRLGWRYDHYEESHADHSRDVAGSRCLQRKRPGDDATFHRRISRCYRNIGYGHYRAREPAVSVAIALAANGLRRAVIRNCPAGKGISIEETDRLAATRDISWRAARPDDFGENQECDLHLLN
jgi:hypothetical protein